VFEMNRKLIFKIVNNGQNGHKPI